MVTVQGPGVNIQKIRQTDPTGAGVRRGRWRCQMASCSTVQRKRFQSEGGASSSTHPAKDVLGQAEGPLIRGPGLSPRSAGPRDKL
ncbi:unnamed protein product [Arctogadus glacialis]